LLLAIKIWEWFKMIPKDIKFNKPKITKENKEYVAKQQEKIKQENIRWYLQHPGWWNTNTGDMLKKHWGLEDVEELKDK